MKLSVIIPVYNEADSIASIIEKVKSVSLPYSLKKQIVIIDDGSTDDTPEILGRYKDIPDILIIHRDKNLGKAASVKVGIENSDGDVLLIQDADMEYTPDSYPDLLKPVVEDKVSVVYGSRFMGTIENMSFMCRIANIISNITLRLLYSYHMTDMNTCYKLFKKDAIKDIEIKSRNFGFDAEITAKLIKKGYRIVEVPIKYKARSKKAGKKMTWLKALELYMVLIKYRFIKA